MFDNVTLEMKKIIFWKEVNMLHSINHPRFVKLIGIIIEVEMLGIISEFIEGQTSDEILNNRMVPVTEAML